MEILKHYNRTARTITYAVGKGQLLRRFFRKETGEKNLMRNRKPSQIVKNIIKRSWKETALEEKKKLNRKKGKGAKRLGVSHGGEHAKLRVQFHESVRKRKSSSPGKKNIKKVRNPDLGSQ